ncbi:MAG: DUF935 family protein [Rikenellaceae bacterium]
MARNIKNNKIQAMTNNAPKTAQNNKISSHRTGGELTQKIIAKNVSASRKDVGAWRKAQKEAHKTDNPRRVLLHQLYDDMLLDGHLTSQIELRKSFTAAAPFKIEKDGKIDDELTDLFANSLWLDSIIDHILDTMFFGASLVELDYDGVNLNVSLIPQTNIVPDKGLFYFDYSADAALSYREMKEYGTWLLEFGEERSLGLINKAVPHVIFKRLAQSCWAELCEIYGIPPRTLRTDTTNGERMIQAKTMMEDMGSAAWMIIDTDEVFEFAKGVATNGEVYDGLIKLCTNEISLIILGAVVGQDTKNGNESKEKSSINLLKGLVKKDKIYVQKQINSTVIPALERIGVIPQGASFAFHKEIDTATLWSQVKEAMPYVDFDIEWLNSTFGMQITGLKNQPPSLPDPNTKKEKLSLGVDDFFA